MLFRLSARNGKSNGIRNEWQINLIIKIIIIKGTGEGRIFFESYQNSSKSHSTVMAARNKEIWEQNEYNRIAATVASYTSCIVWWWRNHLRNEESTVSIGPFVRPNIGTASRLRIQSRPTQECTNIFATVPKTLKIYFKWNSIPLIWSERAGTHKHSGLTFGTKKNMDAGKKSHNHHHK